MNDRRDYVALVLAIGLATGINCVTFAVLYDAIFSERSGLSENATQLLVTAFGGIIGVLGSFLGFKAGAAERKRDEPQDYRHDDDDERRAADRSND